jgi:hypothetical protein
MSESQKIAKSNFVRNPKTGRNSFAKGNDLGKMTKKGFTLADIRNLLRKLEEVDPVKYPPLLKHYIQRLYQNDRLLENFVEKNVPTKTINEHEVKIPDVVEVVHYVQEGKPPTIKEEKDGDSNSNKTTE